MRSQFAVLLAALSSIALAGCDDSVNCGDRFIYDETRMRCACGPGLVEIEGGACMLPDGGVIIPPGFDAGTPRDADVPPEDAPATPDTGIDAGTDACTVTTFYRDADMDGFGDATSAVVTCGDTPPGYVENDEDCNDACATCNPDATELCETSLDEDCDGNPVNGCACTIGSLAHCTACEDACGWDCETSGCNDATQLALGQNHGCALREGGDIVCWGANGSGQLGDGSVTNRSTPVPVTGLPTTGAATMLAAGSEHTCTVLGGAVWCWGRNLSGQLGDGSMTNQPSPVAVTGITTATAVAAGTDHTCALLADRTVRCWGNNRAGQLGDGSTVASPTPVAVLRLNTVIAISAGNIGTCALLEGGALQCWGAYARTAAGMSYRSPIEVRRLPGITQISAGGGLPCALAGGGLHCRADSGVNSTWSAVIASGVESLGASNGHGCALVSGAGVRCWGSNTYGQIGNGSNLDISSPATVIGLSHSEVAQVAVGGIASCALTTLGSIRCWGYNASGGLGDGTMTNRNVPVVTSAP